MQHIPKEQKPPTLRSQPGAHHDVPIMLKEIEKAIQPLPKAAMFELADRGFTTAFQQLVACILSIRTYDEVSLPAAERLLSQAPSPAAMARLTGSDILSYIRSVTFAERKATQILEMARQLADHYDGELPCDPEIMRSFAGVGPKCANLAAGIACGFTDDQRRCPRSSHYQPLGNRSDLITGADHGRTPKDRTHRALGRTQPPASPIRQAYLYWSASPLFIVPGERLLCAGRSQHSPVDTGDALPTR